MKWSIDLNCDVGEGFGEYSFGNDSEIFPMISSANIACGWHAGDPRTMRASVDLSIKHGVAIGAHPGFDDRAGFGRRAIPVTPSDVYEMTLYQIGALSALATAAGNRLAHVKPHGALYHLVCESAPHAHSFATALRDFDRSLLLLGRSGSVIHEVASTLGIASRHEVFIDRAYDSRGMLLPRSDPRSVHSNPNDAVQQTLRLMQQGLVRTVDGSEFPLQADTYCVHGDNPIAVEILKRLHQQLGLSQ